MSDQSSHKEVYDAALYTNFYLAAVNNLTTGQGMHIFDDHCLIVQLPDALGLWNKNILEKTDGIAYPVCEKAFVSNKTDIKSD